MLFRNVFIGVAGLWLASTSAFAADLYGEGSYKDAPEYYPPAFSWTGLYVGAHAGYGWGDAEYEHQNVNFFGGPGGLYDNEINGGLLGAQIGANFQNGILVVGVEGTLSASDLSGNRDFTQYTNDTTTDIDWLATGALRLGIAQDRAHFYVKGGFAAAGIEAGQEYYKAGSERYWDSSETATGWVAGGGAEYALTDSIIIGVDYSYIDLGETTFNGDDSQGVPAIIDSDVTLSVITGRVSYKF